MKTALMLIPSTNESVARNEYLYLCIEKAAEEGYIPLAPALYESIPRVTQLEFIDKMLPLVDVVYLFVDFGIDKTMFEVIDRAVASKIELRYKRIMKPNLYVYLRTSPLHVLSDVCKLTGFTIEQLRGKTRLREIVDARFVYFRRAKEVTRASFASIGLLLGKDHATVMHGVKEANSTQAVVDLYNKCYGQTTIKASAMGQNKDNRSPDREPVERPVLPYRSMDPREQGIPAAEPAMCAMSEGRVDHAFRGYRPHSA